MFRNWKQWARLLRRDTNALYLASKDPRVPLPAKIVAAFVAGYALSPIDLIPDFIPVVGYLDDLILIPMGIWLVIRLIPANVMAEQRAIAEAALERPIGRTAAVAIVGLWVAGATLCGWLLYRRYSG